MAEKFLDDSERLYGEPHPTRYCVRNSRRIVVKVSSCSSALHLRADKLKACWLSEDAQPQSSCPLYASDVSQPHP